MIVGIVGFGYVGQAIGWTYRYDSELIVRDPKLKDSASLAFILESILLLSNSNRPIASL